MLVVVSGWDIVVAEPGALRLRLASLARRALRSSEAEVRVVWEVDILGGRKRIQWV